MARVRAYLEKQWTRILRNKVPLKDFMFAKEVKLGAYKADNQKAKGDV